jgi:hypothetical protein
VFRNWLSTRFARKRLRRLSGAPEVLEDRTVPTILDLTNSPVLASGMVTGSGAGASTGAIFTDSTSHNTSGSGKFGSFVRIENNPGPENGVNTNFPSKTILNDKDAGGSNFNFAIRLNQLPVVIKGGTAYYEFLLDLNQFKSAPLISLDELRLYVSPSDQLNFYDPKNFTLSSSPAETDFVKPVYDMTGADPAGFRSDTYVKLDASTTGGPGGIGGGSFNLFVDVPVAVFGSNLSQYVYLYSKLGAEPLNGGTAGRPTPAPKNGD